MFVMGWDGLLLVTVGVVMSDGRVSLDVHVGFERRSVRYLF